MTTTKYSFRDAVPVWQKGTEKEMNVWLTFRAFAPRSSVKLALTGSACYNVRVNGRFIAFGPARCAHGFYRVDEIDLSSFCTEETNIVSCTVLGYNCTSFYHLNQPSFFCAELYAGNRVIAATGAGGFECRAVTEHERRTQKYSYQRTFTEVYNYDETYRDFETKADAAFYPVELEKTEPKVFITRSCPLNTYELRKPARVCLRGTYRVSDHGSEIRYGRHIMNIGPEMTGFTLEEVSTNSLLTARNIETLTRTDVNESADSFSVPDGEYAVCEMPRNTTGQFCMNVTAEEDTELLLTFSELLEPADRVSSQPLEPIDYRHAGLVSVVIWRLKKGTYTLSTAEPYTAMYVKILARGGTLTVSDLSMNYFGADKPGKRYNGTDETLQKIFDAAVETYRQNTFTIFMDCPSRERAGWLCDSFFTSRVEKLLTGGSTIEHNFLENFLLPASFPKIAPGMLPMCYPGDHYNGNFIPNWAMWYVIELAEYRKRSGDRMLIEQARKRVYELLDYFQPFENEYGLLEKLSGWVFVEWSKSNELVTDVNFPTNMLYAVMLEAVDSLYGDKKAREKAAALRETINRLSFSGTFYCDNMVRDGAGRLVLSGEYTETCQYYAFFCGVATKESRPELWNTMKNDFGFDRVKPGLWPNLREDAKWQNVYPSNIFIGIYLRLECFYRFGEHEKLVEDIKGYFTKMANRTGTLWENETPNASCNHGFASHVLYWMDGLGMISDI